MGTGLHEYIEDNDTENMIEAREVARLCKCLPACTSIEYDAEISQSYFDWKNLFSAWQMNLSDPDFEGMIIGRLGIFFKEAKFVTLKRAELYGHIDFVANCGGLLGLFMGFSIFSLVEIFYFITLRLGYVFWRKQEKYNKNNTYIQ